MHSFPGVGISTAALEKDLSAQHAASVEPGLTGPPTPPDPSHRYQSSTTEAWSHRESQGVGRASCSCSPRGALLNALDGQLRLRSPLGTLNSAGTLFYPLLPGDSRKEGVAMETQQWSQVGYF